MADQLLQPIEAEDWVGKSVPDTGTSIREKLVKLFSATDFVRVQNIDNEILTWQYMPASKEEISFDTTSSTVPMKNVYRQPPEVYQLAPGQTAIIIGANAYLMIETLVKHLIAKEGIKRQPNMPPGVARKFSFSDDVMHQNYINDIYLGKELPGMKPTVQEKPGLQEVQKDNESEFQPIRRRKPQPSAG